MKLVKRILDRFNGLRYPQEYLCFARGSFYQPLHVYLLAGDFVAEDITRQHLFVGYSPLVFTLAGEDRPENLRLAFSHRLLSPNEVFEPEDALAWLEMKRIRQQKENGVCIHYYEGTRGSHEFLTPFQQRVIRLQNEWYNRKPGNVFLPDNLYKQVQIAYAVPRIISLVTVCADNLVNLFPTDLHGPIGDSHYIISLRTGGNALSQVEKTGRVLLSQVEAEAYKTVYRLGKNHMQEMKSPEQFPLSAHRSASLQWPLPEHTLLYREMELRDSFDAGIHRIMLFGVTNMHRAAAESGSLAHIHNSYATWRHNTGLAGNYLLR